MFSPYCFLTRLAGMLNENIIIRSMYSILKYKTLSLQLKKNKKKQAQHLSVFCLCYSIIKAFREKSCEDTLQNNLLWNICEFQCFPKYSPACEHAIEMFLNFLETVSLRRQMFLFFLGEERENGYPSLRFVFTLIHTRLKKSCHVKTVNQ